MILMFTLITLSQTLAFMYALELLKLLFNACLLAALAWLFLSFFDDSIT
jgi:hypothetical protein